MQPSGTEEEKREEKKSANSAQRRQAGQSVSEQTAGQQAKWWKLWRRDVEGNGGASEQH